ncbi:MAG TPA: hypothetical protein VKD71_05675, partial [Gemmataceae bacterium]|nr:hypothetical protein [Gemmataceae bacterium]
MRTENIPLMVLLAALVAAAPAAAQSCLLAESPREGDCNRLTTETTLTGTLKVSRDGKVVPIRIAAKNEHAFAERVVTADKSLICKSVRHYVTAVSRATIDGERLERALAADHRLIVAQRTGDTLFCYCPAGPLTRTELDVVSEHFDTLHLAGILPGKEVSVGDTWKIDSGVAQSICLFDGLISHTLTGKLRQVAAGIAVIGIEGTAKGIENGALADLTISSEVRFDLAKKRIVNVEWKQKDVRDQGPVSPAAEVETTTIVKREPLEVAPDELGAAAVAMVPLDNEPPSQMCHLFHRDAKNRYQFLYARNWHIVGQTDHHLVMRLLDRGDFIAQATITQWQNAGAGKHMTSEEFEKLAGGGTGWKVEEVLERGE